MPRPIQPILTRAGRDCTRGAYQKPMSTPRAALILVKGDADAAVAAPNRTAAAQEPVGLNEQGERLRQTEGIGDIEPRATWGEVPDCALDAAATIEGEGSVFKHPVSRLRSLLDHCLGFNPFRTSAGRG